MITKVETSESERRRVIIETLKDRPFATVRDLVDVLGVSPATIRRDIGKLHDLGAIRKVFGGIASQEGTAAERVHAKPFEENQVLNVEAKKAIAAAAAELVRDGDSVIVNGGSTCFLLAQLLGRRSLKLYTNSMPVAAWVWQHGVAHVVMAGGDLHREPGILYATQPAEPDFYASKYFLGTQAIGPQGLMESHPLLARANRQLTDWADEVVVLADSSKFRIRARHTILSLSRISTLITDSGLAADERKMLEDTGINVIVVEAG
jgi:DeoR family ulaG and ulaABCDEF operon transcriptional repressor